MDYSAPTTPISRQSKHRLLRTKPIEDPAESPTFPTAPSTKRSPSSITLPTPSPVSLQDLLLLSPSPYRKSRPRPQPIILDACVDSAAALTPGSRRKGKTRAAGASPRNARRARRRLEREERELVHLEDDGVGARKTRRSKVKSSRGDRLALVQASTDALSPSPTTCEKENEDGESEGCGNGPWELISELVMWKNVAKSSLWFGLGTMLLLSSCFSKDVSFSMISAVSHLGLLILCLAFFYDSFPQRQHQKPIGGSFQLKEENILQVARLILPMANAALAKCQEIFSGEPLMTLKVAPILIFTAKYGHLITPWRLLASGFFLSFTLPKLYSSYSEYIQKKVEEMRSCIWEAWKSCPHKRFVAASTTMGLWNLFSVKMRLFAAFIFVVVLRHHQNQQHKQSESAKNENRDAELQLATFCITTS